MKLYATTKSERTSKGQGGNKHIETVFQIDRYGYEAIMSVTLTALGDNAYKVAIEPIQTSEGDNGAIMRQETFYTLPDDNRTDEELQERAEASYREYTRD